MDKLKITDGRSQEKIRELFNRVYGLRSTEFIIGDFHPEYIITLNCPDRQMDAKAVLVTDQGAFHGYLSLYPSINEGKMLTYEDIINYLQGEGVEADLDEEAIKKATEKFSEGEIVENVLVAQGVEPIPGRDAELTLHFEKAEKKPKIVGGRIDYKNIDNIVMARKGEVLITKKPATPGSRGLNIKHEEVVPIPGKDVLVLPGDGATVNEAGTIFTATTDGYVDFSNRKLAVYPVYIVKGDIDYSTGNIRFNGSVHVQGDVPSGFRIEADKHILVDGLCQDCELFAKGNVILRTGVKGSGGGHIKAGGSVVLGYAEKAKIYAKDNIEVKKYAFNCELFAGNRIDALSGEGIVAGGTIRAFQDVSVKQLGTQGNSKFTVILGTKYFIEFELERLRAEKQRINDTIGQIDSALGRFDLKRAKIAAHPKIKKMTEVRGSLEALIADLDARENELIAENKARNPRVKVKNKVFEGVTVMFYNVGSVVKEAMSNVVFYYDEKFDEVAWVSLRDVNAIET